jgi:hypothetical protein
MENSMMESNKSNANMQTYSDIAKGKSFNASNSFIEMHEKMLRENEGLRFNAQILGVGKKVSGEDNSKSKSEENGSCSNKSTSNASGNTPGNNMQKYFKIPNGHLFSFQKDIASLNFLGKKLNLSNNQMDKLKPHSNQKQMPKITNSFDDIQQSNLTLKPKKYLTL